jgi:hypothetical protein
MFDGTGGCFAPTQSPLPIAIKPGGLIGPDSSKLNVPGSNVTRVLSVLPWNVDGVGLLPVTVMVNADGTGQNPIPKHSLIFLTSKVPVVGAASAAADLIPSCEHIAFSPG